MYYKLAYRNESTDWEWFEVSHHDTIQSAINVANDHVKTDMPKSELGIFVMNEGASYWKDRQPRRIINLQPSDSSIPAILGNLINDWYKPGNNAR